MNDISKLLIITGAILIVLGLIFRFKFFGLGQLPGDILIRKGNFTFYFPLVTSIIISIILSILAYLLLNKK